MNEYDWFDNRKLRSVDQLRLWSDNPRLDPDEKHVNISDYTSDLLAESGEKDSFLSLVSSIATKGYIPADPIVVWQNTINEKYYVAEGNRRILALKLLRDPAKAPKSIRSHIRVNSALISRESIEKIKVCVAPSFELCEWYINQRHANGTLHKHWSRHQQQRWIEELYDKYNGDVDTVMSITGFTKSELQFTLRILGIRDLALDPMVLEKLTTDEQEQVKSHRLPMTILERWFMNALIKEKWGLEFSEERVNITSDRVSFFSAYAEWIKLVLHRNDKDVAVRINTRVNTDDFEGIFKVLPEVTFGGGGVVDVVSGGCAEPNGVAVSGAEDTVIATVGSSKEPRPSRPLSKNPDRPKLVVSEYWLKTTNHKLDAIFREFKQIPLSMYQNCIAASLRVFLDLAVSEYIESEGCKDEMKGVYKCEFDKITLKQRIEFLKQNNLKSNKIACDVVGKMLNPTSHYSLDILNRYVHGKDTHHTSKQFLNGFWDFLFPLFSTILEIKEL